MTRRFDKRRRARFKMHLHLMRRIAERAIPVDMQEICAIERMIGRMRQAFKEPGRNRYRLRVHLAGRGRIGVAYDTDHDCLVSACWLRPGAEADLLLEEY